MDWIERMNKALAYIENNLDGEISLDEAARIAYSSPYQFQRLFSCMAGVPLSAYIRQRRLSKAAFGLQNGGKVIDVSLAAGYDSPTAFNRAFKSLHGIAPSQARSQGVMLKSYPRISFQITVKGAVEMNYRIVKKDAFRIVGVREEISTDFEQSFKTVPVFWDKTFQSGIVPKILGLMNGEPMGLLGACAFEDDGKKCFYYISVATDKPAEDGMVECVIPASTWAVFADTGAPKSIQQLQQRIFTEWLPSSGYEWSNQPDMEVYLNDDTVNMQYEVWLPVVKKV